ncbi:MAG: PAS domain-containing protein [Nitrospira sp.]|nr:PAS domain-containing protein [bacterium]MBL7049913.1 PAS domain-containing protein [Nitrospira sp.]
MKTLDKKFDDFQQLLELSPVVIGVQEGNAIVFINKAGAECLGKSSPEDIIGSSLLEFLCDANKAKASDNFNNIMDGSDTICRFESELAINDVDIMDIEIICTPFQLERSTAVQFTIHEISKRKKIEDLFIQSKQDWEDTFHTITDMITVHDKDFNIIYANKAAKQNLNLPTVYDKAAHKCFSYYHGTECPPSGCPSCDCLTTGVPANFEIFEPHLNMFIEIRSMPRFNKNNELIGLIHIGRDVSERKKVEEEIRKAKDELELHVQERTSELTSEIAERKLAVEALQKSENKYKGLSQEFHVLLNGIPDNLILLAPDLKIMWANKAAAGMFNRDVDTLSGQYCYSLCCGILSPCENCPTRNSFKSAKEETAEIISSEGRIWDIRAFPIMDEKGKVKNVIELTRDITEKVNLQAGATRTRHLASLGELAAGVAHEINNPVNNIVNYGQILVDEFSDENRDDEIAKRIIKDGDRIATIVRSLLSFARIRKEEKSHMQLEELFSDTLSLTSAQLRKDGIHLQVDLKESLHRVPVHPQQIQQVFLNIISNSRYALNEKYPGTDDNKILKVSCDEISIDGQLYLRVIFHDHGTGIPSNISDKVINPFFSTKPNSVGTGLGLSIIHGIISEHGGRIIINSEEGVYTKVSVDLPAEDESI